MTYESYCQILLPFFLMCCLIRLYFQASVYKICREMYDDGVGLPFQSQPDLIGDKYVIQCLLDLGVDISKAGLPGCGEMKTRNTDTVF